MNTCTSFTPSQDTVARVMARRGRLHAFEKLQAPEVALVVVDMQNSFVQEGGGHAWVPAAASTCPAINRVAHAVRSLGGTVVWVLNTFTGESLQSWSHFHEELSTPAGVALRSQAMAEGAAGHALYADLQPAEGDCFVQKSRYSAFIQGSSDLDALMRAKGITTLLVAGTVTNVCCESTARDAMMLNYRTVMLSDGCSGYTPEEHAITLSNFLVNFGDVQSCDQVMASMKAHAETAAQGM